MTNTWLDAVLVLCFVSVVWECVLWCTQYGWVCVLLLCKISHKIICSTVEQDLIISLIIAVKEYTVTNRFAEKISIDKSFGQVKCGQFICQGK